MVQSKKSPRTNMLVQSSNHLEIKEKQSEMVNLPVSWGIMVVGADDLAVEHVQLAWGIRLHRPYWRGGELL